MGRRGPKSSAEARVVIQGGFGARPEPPPELTEAQIGIWREIAASESADFFNSAALRDLLRDYCRHRSSVEMLSERVNNFKPEWLRKRGGTQEYQDLLRMRERESRAAHTVATKLRLTNQSRYTPQAAATASRHSTRIRPWEED